MNGSAINRKPLQNKGFLNSVGGVFSPSGRRVRLDGGAVTSAHAHRDAWQRSQFLGCAERRFRRVPTRPEPRKCL
jgi:hypothetical protein